MGPTIPRHAHAGKRARALSMYTIERALAN
jgi:hypothetical protein